MFFWQCGEMAAKKSRLGYGKRDLKRYFGGSKKLRRRKKGLKRFYLLWSNKKEWEILEMFEWKVELIPCEIYKEWVNFLEEFWLINDQTTKLKSNCLFNIKVQWIQNIENEWKVFETNRKFFDSSIQT